MSFRWHMFKKRCRKAWGVLTGRFSAYENDSELLYMAEMVKYGRECVDRIRDLQSKGYGYAYTIGNGATLHMGEPAPVRFSKLPRDEDFD